MRRQIALVVLICSFGTLVLTSGLGLGATAYPFSASGQTEYASQRVRPTPTRTPESSHTVTLHSSSPPYMLQMLSYATGGASGFVSYAQDECTEINEDQVSVYISGVYSTGENLNVCLREIFPDVEGNDWCPFWFGLFTYCENNIFLADTINFLVRGFKDGEIVEFSMKDPLGGIERYLTTVDRLENLGGTSEEREEEYETARLAWVASPALGPGEYELTVSGASGTATLNFNVFESPVPNFGASFGPVGHPLVLTHGEEIQLYYAGFDPGQTVHTFLYRNHISAIGDFFLEKYRQYWQNATPSSDEMTTPESDFELVGGFETRVDENGFAEVDMAWPDSLAQGMYALVVPEVIPKDTNAENLVFFTIPFLVALPEAKIDKLVANFRSGPGLSYEVVGWDRLGEQYPVTGRAYGDGYVWYKILLPDQTAAWISGQLAEVIPSADILPWDVEYPDTSSR